jgi:phosphoglycolate phosphatase
LIRLILFDIDGTLLDAGDLSRRTFLRVLAEFVGPEATLGGYSLSGKTDPQIMRDILLQNGCAAEVTKEVLSRALKSYQSHFLSALREADIRPLEGAREVIERLTAVRSDGPILGILSGNMKGLILPKLAADAIPASSFVIVACGSDDGQREKLPAIAVERAERVLAMHILPHEVAIVGDTPLDIRCARLFGAVSIATATGDYTFEQLQAESPTHVLESLLEWGELEQALGLGVF